MIPELMVQEWQHQQAPWSAPIMIEQDLIISRALVELYQKPLIRKTLIFRGGTALNKIYFNPPARYSEDLDFVQITSSPIGAVIDEIRHALDHWLGKPKRKLTERSVKLTYRYLSNDNLPGKLKLEINTTEHFHIFDLVEKNFNIDSSWFSGKSIITTYHIDELMGTKLRALHQRKKGRDLFDLWYVMHNKLINTGRTIDVFHQHYKRANESISRANFEKNLFEKKKDQGFRSDITALIHPRLKYDFNTAYQNVQSDLISKLPGEPWHNPMDI